MSGIYGGYSCIKQSPVASFTEADDSPHIYIACYKRLFSVKERLNTWSYNLDSSTAQKLLEQFEQNNIPYRTKIDIFDELPGSEVELTEPCNSRIVFKMLGKEFHVLNFNSHLLENWIAEKISKSLISKSIESRIELFGNKNFQGYYNNLSYKNIYNGLTTGLTKNQETTKKATKQLSLFEVEGVESPICKK